MSTQTPHVIFIITKLELGGAQKVCLALHKAFQSNSTLISGPKGSLADEAYNIGHFHSIPELEREVSFKGVLFEVIAFFKMIQIIRKTRRQHKTVIVHTHSTKAGIMGRWAAFFARADKIVHTVHGFGFHNYQGRLVWTLIYLLELITSFITDGFVNVSKHDLETGQRLIPRFKKKATLIRAASNSVNPAQRSVRAHDSEPFIIGSISCFKPQKNLTDLISAFYYAQQKTSRDLRLEIIGDGIMRPVLEEQIKRLNLENKISLLGWQQDISPFLQSWHLFALSSLWEGLPCAVIEARFNGVPVVSYNVGGISEVIKTKRNGIILSPQDINGLSDALYSYASDKNLYHQAACYPDKLTPFLPQTMIHEHELLYKSLITTSLL